VEVQPETFSPDEDGIDDNVNISFHFSTPGYTASIQVYDAKGRLVRTLVNNALIGNDGTFSWDGVTDKKEKARIGIYIFYVEVFGLNGETKNYKRTCVLASRL
jgi:flagellar hook assembly protein FlgD